MFVYHAEGYGNNKLKLKEEIGEIVRRVFRKENPERFCDLKYRIILNKETENLDKGKYKILIKVLVIQGGRGDRNFPFLKLRTWLNRWKYKLAVEHNYLTLLDRIRLYGLFPDYQGRKKISA